MIAIGITGGVGSGKSAILKYIRESYNVETIVADDIAKSLYEPGAACYDAIAKEFGDYDIIDDEGRIDRKELAELVFNNEDLLQKLNSIVHPVVRISIGDLLYGYKEDGRCDAVIVEAALFSDGSYDGLLSDYIYVYADEDIRVKRLEENRGYSRQKALAIIDSQLNEESFKKSCKYVIDNSGELDEAFAEADEIMASLGVKRTTQLGEEDMSSEREYVFGLDIGTRNVVGTVGYMDDELFRVVAQSTREHKSRSMLDGQIHDIDKVSKVVAQVKEDLEAKIDFKLKSVCIAAAGRVLQTVTTRVEYEYPQESVVTGEDLYTLDLLGVDKAHRELTHDDDRYKFYCVGYTVMKYYLNDEPFNSLEGHKAERIAEDVIVTFLPQDVVDGLYTAVERAGLSVANLTLEPIAAINVAIPESFRMLNISLVDVGAGTSDICITDDGSIIAYGMIPYAGDELTEVLVKEYLVDFTNAELMKKSAASGDDVTYTDIMGLEHTIPAEEVWEVTKPVLEKITTAVCDKIIELNSGKSVAAVFVVGGGGKAHGFCEMIAEKLGIIKERVALRGEDVMKMVEFEEDIKKDPLLVTPIGICLNYFEQRNSFIMIRFNGEIMKLYDNGYLKVVDAALQAGLSTDEIFPKRGEEITFTVDGVTRMERGMRGESAKVFMNGREVGLNDTLLPNCEIRIEGSTTGESASIKIEDLPEFSDNYVDFMVNNKKVRAPKFVEVNGNTATGDYEIKNGDVIETKPFYTVGQLAEFMDVTISEHHDILVNNRSASMETIIYENFNIEWTIEEPVLDYPKPSAEPNDTEDTAENEDKEEGITPEEASSEEPPQEETLTQESPSESLEEEESKEEMPEDSDVLSNLAVGAFLPAEVTPDEGEDIPEKVDETLPEATPDQADTTDLQEEMPPAPKTEEELRREAAEKKVNEIKNIIEELEGPARVDIQITVNGTRVTLTGKREYIFVDIYNFYEFDTEIGKGKRIVTKRNGQPCSFADAIFDGDEIDLYWEDRK